MLGDPLALYRMPREGQIAVLGLLQYETRPHLDAVEGDGVRVGYRDGPELEAEGRREYENPDPTQGARMPRPMSVVAVSSEARERADRFRVA